MIRENALAVWDEVYAAFWWCRCKSAGTVALAAAAIGAYCQWRGPRAFVALWFMRRTVDVALCLMPAPLRPLVPFTEK